MEDGRLARHSRGKFGGSNLQTIAVDTEKNMRRQLKFRQIAGQFAVCRLPANVSVPAWATAGDFISVTRTADELSIVCPLQNVPPEHKPEVPWICFKLEGPFDFLQVGILASFIAPLAENGVPLFAMSTYDTDYVLVHEDFAGAALGALQKAGHELTNEAESGTS